MRIPPVRSLLASSLTLLVIAASATACGDDEDKKSDDDSRSSDSSSETIATDDSDDGDSDSEGGTGTLSADQVEQAAITLDNLGEGWSKEDDEDEDDEDAPGCLGDIDRLTDSLDEVEEVDVSYAYGEQGLPQVDSGVTTYADEAALTDLFDQFQTELENCTTVSWDDEGTKVELTLRTVPDLTDVEVDDQSSFVASGQLTLETGETSPIHLYGTFVRVGPSIATIGSTSLSEITDEHEAWAIIGADRLSAVAAGEEPEETVAPAPAS